jgi:MFS family permease
MIRPTSAAGRLLGAADSQPHPVGEPTRRAVEGGTYGWVFWCTYASNLLITTANATLFRYGDFVALHGGTELLLGLIVGVGMVGSLLMRTAQGIGVDLYGVRRIWVCSSLGFVLACLGHLAAHQAHSPFVFALRILYQTSIAGIFGASIAFISRRSPVYRMAEVVGTLGTSGFLGMIFGASLVDWLYGSGPVTEAGVQRMFLAAAALGALSGLLAWLATHNDAPPSRRRRVPVMWLLRRYNPGRILLMGITMGFGLGLSTIFLRPYAASLGIAGIGMFFGVYAMTAFVTRLAIRRLPERIGINAMVVIGVGCLSVDMLLYLPVRAQWHFVVPAVVIGIAHALLFPAVVAGGSSAFPDRYRGLGTALMLAMFDVGMLIGSPTIGSILRAAEMMRLPKYPTMFVALSAIFASIAVWYAVSSRGQRPVERARRLGPPIGVPQARLARRSIVSRN